ncbi:MAG: hypothetical protein Q9184_005888 [Pyrenodesmia sp. 2 TL-2023]
MQAAAQDVAVPHDYQDSCQQRHHAATSYPAASTSSQLFSLQATRSAFSQAVTDWSTPQTEPPPLNTPLLPTESIKPAVHLPQDPTDTSISRLPQPQASSQKVFHSYNPKSETRTKDKSRRSCVSSESTSAQTLSAAQISSCYLGSQSIGEHGDGLLINARFDDVLDGTARPAITVDNPRRNLEEDVVGELQAHSRRSCSLLYLLAHPETNTVIHNGSRPLDLPGLLRDFLRQLYRKVNTHWEAFFDKFRSWLSGPRNKTSFPRQKDAIATALAQLLTCVELYDAAVTKWSGMEIASPGLSSYLEFLGKGVQSKSFDAERKKTWMNTLAMQLSTGSPDAPAAFIMHLKQPLLMSVNPNTLDEHLRTATEDACTLYMMPIARTTGNAISAPGAVSIPSALASSMQPVAPEDAHDFIFNCAPDPDVARAWEEQATAQYIDLQRQLEAESRSIREIDETLQEKKQNVSNLLPQIHELGVSLGLVKAPGPSVFDDNWPSPTLTSEEQSDSPGALTLVDSVLEVALPSPIKEESPDRFPAPIMEFGSNDAEDVLMKTLTTDQLDQSIDQTFVDIRKRKRFSKHSASKKVCIEEDIRPSGMTCPPSAGVRPQKYGKPQIIRTIDKTTGGVEVNDEAIFPVTSRPISWPRTGSRLFRYSAGISVKKLTDVFENLGLKQRQL